MTLPALLLGPWLPLALVAAALLISRRVPALGERDMEGGQLSAAAPFLAGILSALLPYWMWTSLDPVPVIHDEVAYILQARIFALGRWVSPSPPLPEFFEQFHVFVTPVLAPKYPPGHALLLVPGIWLGAPALVPVLLSGFTGSMLYILARRFTNDLTAMLTVGLWMIAEVNVRFRPTMFSEVTTTALWLLGWWQLLRYRDTKQARWLAGLSATVAWGGITRPLTMVVFAIPVAVASLVLIVRGRHWRHVAIALPVGLAIAAIEPIWSHAVLHTWTGTPYSYYSRVYFPLDMGGFGLDTTPPLRPVPPDMQPFVDYARPIHEAYTRANLPNIFRERVIHLKEDSWGTRGYLLGFAIVGLLVMSSEVALGVITTMLLLGAYLWFPHPTEWSVYYLEIQPLIAFLTALGVWQVASLAARGRPRRVSAALPVSQGALLVMSIVALANLAPAFVEITEARTSKLRARAYQEAFRTMIERIPDRRAIVFVNYGPRHSIHLSLTANDPDPATARVWIVHDLGPENERLMRFAPERTAYRYSETLEGNRRAMRIEKIGPTAPDGGSP